VNIDVIGDVHGQLAKLVSLLSYLGFSESALWDRRAYALLKECRRDAAGRSPVHTGRLVSRSQSGHGRPLGLFLDLMFLLGLMPRPESLP
jgi:hypothetical protein